MKNNYKLHIIKTERFKRISFSIFFRNEIDLENYTKKILLFELLTYTSMKYKKLKDLNIECENLYNANTNDNINTMGKTAEYEMYIDFINPKYTNEDYLEKAMRLPFDIIFNPRFDEKVLEKTKYKLKKHLENKFVDPNYSFFRNVRREIGNPYVDLDIEGDLNKIDDITIDDIKEQYELLKNDLVEMYVIGNVDEEEITKIIEKYAKFDNKIITIEPENLLEEREKVKEVITRTNNKQTLVYYLYNIINPTVFERKYVMNVLTDILGGNGSNNKLFNKVRAENSLCYSISSNCSYYSNYLSIFTKIDKKNIDKCTSLIEEIVDTLAETITEEELKITIQNIENDLMCCRDSLDGIRSNEIRSEYMYHANVEERIKEYKKVTLEDVINLSKKLKLSLKCIQEGDGNEEN